MPTELIISCDAESTEKFIVVELSDAELADRHITDAAAYVLSREARKHAAIKRLRTLALTDELAETVLEIMGLDDDDA
jgi:hypothetical protein